MAPTAATTGTREAPFRSLANGAITNSRIDRVASFRACVGIFHSKVIMVQCAVKGCKSRTDVHTKLDNSIHFHRVPKNPQVREKWMRALNKHDIKDSTRICSCHFRKENYYLTTHGLHKLLITAIPDINLHVEEIKDYTTSSSDDEQTPSLPVECLLQNTNEPSPSQQTSSKEIRPEIATAANVSGSRIKHVEEVKEDITHSSDDEQIPKYLQRIINNPGVFQQTTSQEIRPAIATAANFLGSPMKSDIQDQTYVAKKQKEIDPLALNAENKVRTPLERKLLKEVRRLQELSKKRLEAINCLEEQNRRLLTRNCYLQQALDNYEKLPEEVNSVAQQESNFFSM